MFDTSNTGFKSNGSALNHVPAVDPPAFTFVTGAFPNQLNGIVLHGSRAYVPNTGASPDGPVRFNVNVQALLSVIDTSADTEGQANGQPQTINLNRGINFEAAGPNKLFLAVPWAIAFKHKSDEGYVVALTLGLFSVIMLVSIEAAKRVSEHRRARKGANQWQEPLKSEI